MITDVGQLESYYTFLESSSAVVVAMSESVPARLSLALRSASEEAEHDNLERVLAVEGGESPSSNGSNLALPVSSHDFQVQVDFIVSDGVTLAAVEDRSRSSLLCTWQCWHVDVRTQPDPAAVARVLEDLAQQLRVESRTYPDEVESLVSRVVQHVDVLETCLQRHNDSVDFVVAAFNVLRLLARRRHVRATLLPFVLPGVTALKDLAAAASIADCVVEFLHLLMPAAAATVGGARLYDHALQQATLYTTRRGISSTAHQRVCLFIADACFPNGHTDPDGPSRALTAAVLPSSETIDWSTMPAVIRQEAWAFWHRRRSIDHRLGLGGATTLPVSSTSHAIGIGGHGAVWRFQNRGVAFAVKVPDVDPTRTNSRAPVAALCEFEALARVGGHPNVVYCVGECFNPYGIVMELVTLDGAPCCLRQWLRLGASAHRHTPTRTEVRADLLRQLCDGMAFVHAQGVVHSDLSTRNVLVGRYSDGALCVKVSDFGLALDVVDGPARRRGGTPAYACPCDDVGTTDQRFDVWSFGVIAAEVLLTARPRVDVCALQAWRRDGDRRLQRQLSDDVRAMAAVWEQQQQAGSGSDCLRWRPLWYVVESCLRCDREERPSFSELSQAIGGILHSGSDSESAIRSEFRVGTSVFGSVDPDSEVYVGVSDSDHAVGDGTRSATAQRLIWVDASDVLAPLPPPQTPPQPPPQPPLVSGGVPVQVPAVAVVSPALAAAALQARPDAFAVAGAYAGGSPAALACGHASSPTPEPSSSESSSWSGFF